MLGFVLDHKLAWLGKPKNKPHKKKKQKNKKDNLKKILIMINTDSAVHLDLGYSSYTYMCVYM